MKSQVAASVFFFPHSDHHHYTRCLQVQVPAGLHVDLQVQIFTLSAAQVGEEEPRKRIVQDIPIHTEVDILYLPVMANILNTP